MEKRLRTTGLARRKFSSSTLSLTCPFCCVCR